MLAEVQDGTYAKKWMAEHAAGRPWFDATRKAERSHQIVAEVMALLARHPNLPRLVLHETLSGGQRLTPMLREWIAPAFARARELVEANPAARRWRIRSRSATAWRCTPTTHRGGPQ